MNIKQLQSQKSVVGWSLGIPAVILLMAWGLHVVKGASLTLLTVDPVVLGAISVYAGFMSQIGIFGWAAAATLCLFGAAVSPQAFAFTGARGFLLLSGIATLWLGLDDVFLVHEHVLPGMGVPQKLVLATYALGGCGYLVLFRQHIMRHGPLLLMAMAGFGASVGVDVVIPPGEYAHFIEDGAKLIGISCWCGYFWIAARTIISDVSPERD
ncbi:MAG: hypothetical protein O3A51_07260 [Verrucomicrobia bacterium]|nr:hypothetical protein [Verrucomicrobiota bacterium]